MKTIIITAGGTIEKIDGVRGISNFSSGKLGINIAEVLAHEHNVILLRGKKSPHSKPNRNIQEIEITDTQSLIDTLQQLSLNTSVDIFIHAMAVADYTVNQVTSVDTILDNLKDLKELTIEDIRKELLSPTTVLANKVSSEIVNPILILKQTPKVILQIKNLWNNITLIGFKLLNTVSENELCEVAMHSMKKSHADYILANDLQNIQGEQHKAILLDRYGNKTYVNTKIEIAQLFLKIINKGQ
jgi:phosphopantothenate-cysteine ligase